MALKHTLRGLRSAFMAALAAITVAGGLSLRVHAAPTAYYVALTGSDTNPGTQAAPFRSFAKGTAVLNPGDTLYINAGVYNEPIKMTRSGIAGAPITIQPVAGAKAVIDLLYQADDNVWVTGSYITIKWLEIRNSSGYCVNLQGTHNTFQGSLVHDCRDMGIFTDGQDEAIIGNTVYHASAANSAFSMAGGWYSGIKVRVGGNRILIQGNRTHHNFGEGIAITRASNVTVRHNISYDNAAPNIYVDNSYNITIDRNFAFNHGPGFGSDGIPSDNIGLGEEPYPGWGARLSSIRITNNITFNGKHGVIFYGNDSGTPGGGLKNSIIAYNTLWGSTNSELSVIYDTGQSGNVIANNIIQQPAGNLVLIPNPAGITFTHNFWVNKLPPAYARGPGDKTGDVRLAAAPSFSPAGYMLTSASPAIDAGSLVSGVVSDYASAARPAGAANDLGAYEFNPGTP